ncbi:MAG: hypothetical protein GY697_14280 [Desulfobacterales bacterium]|nr:hypothetical protein [Desulfobacterales bacterium]
MWVKNRLHNICAFLPDIVKFFFRLNPNRRPAGSKTAIVISKTVDLGLSRMVSLLSEGVVNFEIEAFRSVEEAMDWLA